MLYRLKHGRGETLVETLVALLISSISLIMFANMILPAVNLTKTGESWNAAVNKRSTLLERKPDEDDLDALLNDVDVETLGDLGDTLDGTVSIENLIDSEPVTLYITDYDGKEQVISYGMP